MCSSITYTEQTRDFLSLHGLTARNVWHLQDNEVQSLEVSIPGIQAAWSEVRRRPQPVFPFVGPIFGRREPPQEVAAAPPVLPRDQPPPKKRKAWSGLPAAAREPAKFASDAAKRRQAAL